MAGYLAQAGAFAIGGAALSGYALYSDIKYAGQKRKFIDEGVDLSYDTKRARLSLPVRNNMAMFRRRTFRRRFRRRFKRRPRRFRRRRGSFKRAVRRVILKTAEPKKYDDAIVNAYQIREGDGTSRVSNVVCPMFGLGQGVEDDQFLGNKYWLKGYSIRGQVGTSGEVTTRQGAIIRISLVWSREQNPGVLFAGWTEFTSATTSTANPTATSPNVNPRFFESATATLAFVGNGFVLPFDTTNVRVLASRNIVVNPGVENQAGSGVIALPTPFKFYFPINKWVQIRDPDETDLSNVALTYKYGVYYLVMQAISNTNDITDQTIAEMDYKLTMHYRDP